MFKVIVCGGRDYYDPPRIHEVLQKVWCKHPDLFIIEGGAAGADRLAGIWAEDFGVPYAVVPALWGKHGKRAGMIRNQHMLDLNPNGVVAFPGGVGTAGMVRIAKDAGVPVWEIA